MQVLPRLPLFVSRHLPLSVNHHRKSWLLSLYLGLAPVYHLIGDKYLHLFKAVLAVAAVAVVLIPPLLSGKLRLPARALGPPGFLALILLSAPGVVQAPAVFLNVMFVMDIGYAAGLMWCFFYLARQGENIPVILTRALSDNFALGRICAGERARQDTELDESLRPVLAAGVQHRVRLKPNAMVNQPDSLIALHRLADGRGDALETKARAPGYAGGRVGEHPLCQPIYDRGPHWFFNIGGFNRHIGLPAAVERVGLLGYSHRNSDRWDHRL